ncbi:hypothetical protein BWK59_14710 [Flavobacterium davisii]|uniref:Uncharacterized protein n=1 Tax=Flavobacterium davisii TaxID=2906077 RepID=A0A246GEW9_9FLAO|nr:hypothetical protein [Flavobacterium davisii]OWP82655.1 hypothetical protein BWK59_14710 [Flavobacterium davisii]
MKKIFLTLVVASSLFSCSKDEVNEPKSVESVKVNSKRVSEGAFDKFYYNAEGDIKLTLAKNLHDSGRITIASTEESDSDNYFILRDAEVSTLPVGPNFRVNTYHLSDAYFMKINKNTPFTEKFNNMLKLSTGSRGFLKLNIAKDFSYVELSDGYEPIKFTKL